MSMGHPRVANRVRGFTPWLHKTSPLLSWDWKYQIEVRKHLHDLTEGRIKRLLISLPPQHGKTTISIRYLVWRCIRQMGLRTGIVGYNQNYANRLSRLARRVAREAGVSFGEQNAVGEWNFDNESSVYAVGVGGGLTGRPIDFAYLDDVVKSREEADSEAYRERTWEWYMDDFVTRLQENAPILAVNTRWHEDDLFGRILASDDGKRWRYLKLPALAEENDPIHREVGEPLCPERFSLETLLERKEILGEGFEGLYQQNPVPRGGLFFRREWFEIVDKVPDGEYGPPVSVRYFDLAASVKDSACYTSGVRMSRSGDTFYIEDVVRGRWQPADRNEVIKQTAQADTPRLGFRKSYFEQQPGAAGLETSQRLIAMMAGLAIEDDRVTGDKKTRAEPLASQAKAGNVKIVAGDWNGSFLSELCSFPRGRYSDQVDSTSGCLAKLTQEQPTVIVATY